MADVAEQFETVGLIVKEDRPNHCAEVASHTGIVVFER